MVALFVRRFALGWCGWELDGFWGLVVDDCWRDAVAGLGQLGQVQCGEGSYRLTLVQDL